MTKSRDLRILVTSLHDDGLGVREIFHRLNGHLAKDAISHWIRTMETTDEISSQRTKHRERTIRTKGMIMKVKRHLSRQRKVSEGTLANELNISRISVRRMLKEDLECYSCKLVVESAITNEHKEQRKTFAKWVQKISTNDQTRKILFSADKKCLISMVCTTYKTLAFGQSTVQKQIKGML